jgi:hypothetical protein
VRASVAIGCEIDGHGAEQEDCTEAGQQEEESPVGLERGEKGYGVEVRAGGFGQPGRPAEPLSDLRSKKSRGGEDADAEGEDLCAGDGAADALECVVAAAELGSPPESRLG